jgi:hypothetical protein
MLSSLQSNQWNVITALSESNNTQRAREVDGSFSAIMHILSLYYKQSSIDKEITQLTFSPLTMNCVPGVAKDRVDTVHCKQLSQMNLKVPSPITNCLRTVSNELAHNNPVSNSVGSIGVAWLLCTESLFLSCDLSVEVESSLCLSNSFATRYCFSLLLWKTSRFSVLADVSESLVEGVVSIAV